MPLKGQAKIDYMRRYRTPHMREYRKRVSTGNDEVSTKGSTQTAGSLQDSIKPLPKSNLTTRLKKSGLKVDGNRISLALQSKSSPLREETRPRTYTKTHQAR